MSDIDRFLCTAYKLLCSAIHSIIVSSKNFPKYSQGSDMLSREKTNFTTFSPLGKF